MLPLSIISFAITAAVGITVLGCATSAKTQSNTDVELQPESFEATFGGYLGSSYRVELQENGILQYLQNPRTLTTSSGTDEHRINVTTNQWREFRRALNGANVWRWNKDYTDSLLLGGRTWHLKVKYSDRSVDTHGCGKFPPKSEFDQFLKAVVNLVEGREFQ